MVKKLAMMKHITIYEDDMEKEDGRVLIGKKGGSKVHYIISNPKTANLIYDSFRKKERNEKIDKLLDG